MKVLIVSQYFWPEQFRINDIARSLVKKGVEVDVLTGQPNYPQGNVFEGYSASSARVEQWEGCNVYRVPLFPRGQKSGVKLALNYLSFVFFASILGPWMLRGRSYSVVFTYGVSPILSAIPANLLSWIKKCRSIIWVQDLWPESLSATNYVKNPTVLKVVSWIVSWIYKQSDLLLMQSYGFEKSIRPLAPNAITAYFPNSVEPVFSEPESMDVELPDIPQLKTGFPVLFAGNIGTAQAVDVILDAAEKLKGVQDIHFVLLGRGSRWEWAQNEVASRGLNNVTLAGQYPVQTMPGLMSQAEVLLVTLTDEPIFALTVPSKVQAYMATGKPIVACLNGDGSDLILRAEAGLTAPAGDVDKLAQAIQKLHEMQPSERAQIGQNGRRFYEKHFNHDRLMDQLVTIFQGQVEHKE